MNAFLLPAAWLYDGITALRNLLFDYGILVERSYPIPIIGIGNLAVGGTGKTPHVELFVRWLLKEQKRVAVLSRGYGRKTRGFALVDQHSTAKEVGDEPLQIFRHFENENFIGAVCENRRHGIELLLSLENPPDVILLDDAFQHRYVRPGLRILLTEFSRTYHQDYLLPAGRLRERACGAKRADIVIITKCPDTANEADCRQKGRTLHLRSEQQLFFTAIDYAPLPFVDEALLITGIAHPKPIVEYLRGRGIILEHMTFSDHHDFSAADLRRITQAAERHNTIFTTEKDFARLELSELPREVCEKIKPISIAPHVLWHQSNALRQLILNYVNKNPRGCRVD